MKADIIVLGGGPGGYLAAERAAAAGKSVVLIEKRALGGTCLNEGCIPSKAMLNSAKLYQHAQNSKGFGVTADNVEIHQEQVIQRKNQVVGSLVAGVKAIMDANQVTVVSAMGYVEGRTSDGFMVRADDKTYIGEKLILACGSVPVIPGIPGLKEGIASGYVMTNAEALSRTNLPEKLVVIGGGVIGLEMASYYAMVGVEVTIVEMLDKIAGPTEAEISEILLRAYKRKGIKFKLGCKVTGVTGQGVLYEQKGSEKIAEADAVLCAIGRRAYTENMGLENLGLEMNRSAVVTDEHLRTNVEGVYAVGDVNGKIMLAHTAYREAEVAVNHILGIEDTMDYSRIPSVIYTDPEVAGVGETEESAAAKGMKVRSISVSMNYSGRYLAEVERGDGICKLIVNLEDNTVVGVHMIGSYASEIICGAEMMIASKKPLAELQKLVFPHPTVGEVIREALFM
ncbi:dihydrolipoyl dehydrogenase [Lactonifactor longoviformis]|uniref:dihydrolipoyl dehydrogenase n=1 Tax=Lactonifactor longoviformis TaxID=341220 RepID=UPI0036F3DECD